MKIYQFPKKIPENKNRSEHKETKDNNKTPSVEPTSINPKNKKDTKVLDDILEEVKETILNEGWEEDVDLDKINKDMFFFYLKWFPCFKPFQMTIKKQDFDSLYADYSEELLTCEQELIFELLLELMSPYDFGFTIADMFLVLDKPDRQAVIRVLGDFSEMLT